MNPRTLIVGAVGAACLISPSTGLGHTGAVAGGCYYDPAGTAQLGSSFTYQKFPVNVSSVVNYSATFDNVIVEQGRVVIRPTFSGQTLTVEGRRVPTTFGTHSVTVSTWWDLPGSKQRIDRSFTVTCPDNRPPVFPTPTPVPPVSEVVPGPTGGPADDEVVKLPSKPDRRGPEQPEGPRLHQAEAALQVPAVRRDPRVAADPPRAPRRHLPRQARARPAPYPHRRRLTRIPEKESPT